MKTQLMTVMTAVIFLSSQTMGQRWGGGWGAARRWNFRTPYTSPIAEPEPEPEPFNRRLSRRLINRQRTIKNQIQNLMIPTSTAPPPVLTTTQSQKVPTVTTPLQATLPERRKIILKLLNESFSNSVPAEDLQFDEIFSESVSPNPWAIDTAQFEIVPAVPSRDTPDVVRVPKDVSGDNKQEKDLFIVPVPRQFSPVPAVPDVTTAPDDKLPRQPKNTLSLNNEVGNTLEEQKVKNQKTMNKEGKCLERCVQQFCIPEDDLGMFSNCVDKCKTFCL